MARAHSIYIVVLNTRVLRAFTVKHECEAYLEDQWPKCPRNLQVLKVRDGYRASGCAEDITAALYGLKEKS